jgi:HEPN domain-containing protein
VISRTELRRIARSRLSDAEALYAAGRYDGAVYLTGYAVEVALKARICRTLKWSHFPSTGAEFQQYQSFRTHDLNVLLNLSGVRERIRANYSTEWSLVVVWNPEMRYRPTGSAQRLDTRQMLDAAATLLTLL